MYGKPKRKRTPDPDTIEFLTGNSVEQCVERLERGPARTLDQRLSVRVAGSRFVVEAEGEPQGHLTVTAELRGTLHPINPGTRVRARFENKNPHKKQRKTLGIFTILMPLGFGILVVSSVNDSDDPTTVGLALTTTIFIVLIWAIVAFSANAYRIAAFNKHVPNLKGWLRGNLYTPPREKDI